MTDLATLSLAWIRSPAYIDMTSRQIAMLALLCDEQGPHDFHAIAATMKVPGPIVTRAHKAMGQLGLVRRVVNYDDGRKCFIEATDAGRALRHEIRAAQC